jgi:predicted HTH domain antitoxin
MSKTLAIELEDDVFPALQEDPEEITREMRLFSAVKWYEMGKISQEKAAEIANMSRTAFINALSQYSITPFQETAEEIRQGLKWT